MAAANNKTIQTSRDPAGFLNTIEPAQKQADCFALLELMHDLSGEPPKMWGTSIVGFGSYHYKYASGREGDSLRIGFSPRAQNISIYIMPGHQDFDDLLAQLGKHKTGKSCLYIKRLSDIDEAILRQIIQKGLALLAEIYPD